MTDKEIKKLLKNAYCLPESDKGSSFIKEHEKRNCRFFDVIKNEIQYMGLKSALFALFLCALFLVTAKNGNENFMWFVSSFIPVCSLVPMSLIFRSEKYGMCEIEAASRFSLKFVRLIRMLILGAFGSFVILCESLFFRSLWTSGILDVVMYIIFPYFVSVWGSLLVARKMHGKESTYGVPLVCVATGFLPSIIKEFKLLEIVPDYVYVILLAILLVELVKECIKYINERSNVLWNLY